MAEMNRTSAFCAALAPSRVRTRALDGSPIADWMREQTDGLGVDVLLDCSARAASAAATADALNGLTLLVEKAPPGWTGWTIPLEVLLQPIRSLPGYAELLARLAARAQ